MMGWWDVQKLCVPYKFSETTCPKMNRPRNSMSLHWYIPVLMHYTICICLYRLMHNVRDVSMQVHCVFGRFILRTWVPVRYIVSPHQSDWHMNNRFMEAPKDSANDKEHWLESTNEEDGWSWSPYETDASSWCTNEKTRSTNQKTVGLEAPMRKNLGQEAPIRKKVGREEPMRKN